MTASQGTDRYGAVAAVRGQGHAFHGYATGATPAIARAQALANCADANCVVLQEYGPGQCLIVVLGTEQIYFNTRDFTKAVFNDTQALCARNDKDCTPLVSTCLP